MGRRPCCEKEGLNRGAWTAMEDKILTNYIAVHGEGKWRNLPLHAGLKRCGKSCRLRWLNYLKPDIKRGNITRDEEDLIIRLHKLLGNRWSLIAGRLPGRTDNEIKNYWNTNIAKRVHDDRQTKQLQFDDQNKLRPPSSAPRRHNNSNEPSAPTCVVRTKATRCTKVVISQELQNIQLKNSNGDNGENKASIHDATENNNMAANDALRMSPQGVLEPGPMWALDDSNSSDLKMDMDMDIDDHILSKVLEAGFSPFSNLQQEGGCELMSSPLSDESLFFNEGVQSDVDIDWIANFLQL